ncbi:conjugal transfer protein TraF [Methylomonas sp. AM2-LC]|uniref:conjugal transfer protein TraF n=1 Tax=Methylomonas sp. AM2-LC TaxID=3153301 RepID=UPI003267A273
MNRNYALLLILLTWMFQVSSACGDEAVAEPEVSYFADKQRGWFWYEVLPEPVLGKKPEPDLLKSAPSQSETNDKQPKVEVPPPTQATQIPPDEPAPLSSAWLRKNMESYLNQAIDDPSHENVAAFYYLQRVMMDKAERFTNAARYVVMSDPQLDETVRRPIATYAANEANHQASVAAERALKDIAGQAGILFFFRSDCAYCHVQAPILSMLERAYGFKVYAVSLDGLPMPNGLFGNFKLDRGQAALLGVEQTPAMFLMKPPKKIVPLSQGVLSLEEMTGRILLAGKEAGWIDPSQYQTTQGIRSTPMLLPTAGSISPTTAQDPLSLIQALQNSAQFGSNP